MTSVASRNVPAAETTPEPSSAGAVWARITALAGAVFFALVVAFANLRSTTPSATDSGQKVIDYVTTHQSQLELGAALLGLAMAAALVWVSGLYSVLRRAEPNPGVAVAAVAGGTLAATSGALSALIQGTLAVRIADLDAADARVTWTMCLMSIGAILLGLAVVVGVTGVVSLKHHLFAPWFGVASLVLALGSIAGVFLLGSVAVGIQAAAGIAVLLDGVWMLLVSLFVWRKPTLAGTASAIA
jgi:hypothetical protein